MKRNNRVFIERYIFENIKKLFLIDHGVPVNFYCARLKILASAFTAPAKRNILLEKPVTPVNRFYFRSKPQK